MSPKMNNNFEIRNSTAEFLIFQAADKAEGVQVLYRNENIWCTQKAMATLFDCSTDNIGLHLKNIFAAGELVKESVTEKISATASDGKNYNTHFYNLDAVISVGYRVNSIRATQFRQWATWSIDRINFIQHATPLILLKRSDDEGVTHIHIREFLKKGLE